MNTNKQPLPDDLAKAIEEADLISKNPRDYYNGEIGLSVAEIELLRDAAKHSQDLAQRVRELEDYADLMCDDFQRIKAILQGTLHTEIVGICERAVKVTRQNIPVIVQRDQLEQLSREKDELIEKLVEALQTCHNVLETVKDRKGFWGEVLYTDHVSPAIQLARERGFGGRVENL